MEKVDALAAGDRRESTARALILLGAFVSFALSVTLYFGGDEQQGIFVGLWCPRSCRSAPWCSRAATDEHRRPLRPWGGRDADRRRRPLPPRPRRRPRRTGRRSARAAEAPRVPALRRSTSLVDVTVAAAVPAPQAGVNDLNRRTR